MSLEIILGPMFSGKSTHILAHVRRRQAIGLRPLIIKPTNDTRYTNAAEIVTHDGMTLPCIMWDIKTPLYVTTDMYYADCIIVEEAQFFTELRGFVKRLVKQMGKDVLVVGLDGDYKQYPFGEIMRCIPFATTVSKLNALCASCGDGTVAPFTKKKKIADDTIVEVGGADKYAAVCIKHL